MVPISGRHTKGISNPVIMVRSLVVVAGVAWLIEASGAALVVERAGVLLVKGALRQSSDCLRAADNELEIRQNDK